jgi:hypothetical protein
VLRFAERHRRRMGSQRHFILQGERGRCGLRSTPGPDARLCVQEREARGGAGRGGAGRGGAGRGGAGRLRREAASRASDAQLARLHLAVQLRWGRQRHAAVCGTQDGCYKRAVEDTALYDTTHSRLTVAGFALIVIGVLQACNVACSMQCWHVACKVAYNVAGRTAQNMPHGKRATTWQMVILRAPTSPAAADLVQCMSMVSPCSHMHALACIHARSWEANGLGLRGRRPYCERTISCTADVHLRRAHAVPKHWYR